MANTSLPNYMDKKSLIDSYYAAGGGGVQAINYKDYNQTVANYMSSIDLLQGIECSPYQFMDTVDVRYNLNTSKNTTTSFRYIGQKYAQKIMSQMPLVFFAPCEPVFMEDFDGNDKDRVISSLLDENNKGPLEFILDKNAQYYGVRYAYADYYNYVNIMLNSIAFYLGIQDETVTLNGESKKIKSIDWSNSTNDFFRTYFSAKENVIFFADSLTTIDLNFSNNTTTSSLASQINGYSEQVKELQFLLGSDDSTIANLYDATTESVSSISKSLSGVLGQLGGGIVGSLADKGVNTILNGGKVIFPEIWADSEHSESYSLNFKLRSPDHDSLSIFLNILKPYCLLLALTMPRTIVGNSNGYRSPFLVKCFSKGLFNINMGMVESLSVTKGDECQWNDDGLPTQMDISLSVKNLYSHLAMSGYESGDYFVTNSQFQDFLANTAGLNVVQFGANTGNRIDYKVYKLDTYVGGFVSRKFNQASQAITNLIYSVIKRI